MVDIEHVIVVGFCCAILVAALAFISAYLFPLHIDPYQVCYDKAKSMGIRQSFDGVGYTLDPIGWAISGKRMVSCFTTDTGHEYVIIDGKVNSTARTGVFYTYQD
jgi:hypothetical protein